MSDDREVGRTVRVGAYPTLEAALAAAEAYAADEDREVGLVVERRTRIGLVLYRAGAGWCCDPTDADLWGSEAGAQAVAGRAGGTVRVLMESGELLSLDKQADLYGSDPFVDATF